jgi:hypothetical protein
MRIPFILLVLGIVAIIADILTLVRVKKDTGSIAPDDENLVYLTGFIGVIGIWLVFLTSALLIGRLFQVHSKWIMIFGIVAGIVTGLKHLNHWGLSDDQYQRKPALGEPVGGMAIGCFGAILYLVLGIIMGYILYRWLS